MKQELPTIPGPIGVFDSGYGGLTILSKIREALPQYDYIYLGDNARTPYGTRSFEIVYEFTLQAVTKLFEMGCHLVILACNTASAKALRSIQINDLPGMDPARRVLGVIRPTVECIGSITQSRHVGVLATAGTIKSESYPLEIHKLFPDIQVAGEACPLWVSLVENNEAEGDGTDYFVRKYINELLAKDAQIDTVILGCTHYPLLLPKIKKHMLGRKARLVAKEAHRKTGRLLDIGTGTGYFSDTMVRRGWKVEAVEKSPQAREFAKTHFELEVKPESALKEFAPASFDVITLWHVMEHLESLNETWETLRELLTEKGVLIVAVPNCSSYDAKRYGEYWAAYDVPRHLWHFTPGTIHQLASRHGFIMAARHPMPFDAFYVSMLSEKHRGSSCSFLKGMFVGTLAWFNALGRKERSSSMIYVFRKKR